MSEESQRISEFVDRAIRGTKQTIVDHPADTDYWTGFLHAMEAVAAELRGTPNGQ